MDPTTFREYDIRGVVGKEIGDEDVPLLGRTFGTYMAQQQKKHVVLGRDCRLSSDRYRDLLVEGLLAAGMDVVDLGVCTTPLLYFALRHLDLDGGIMITASHNPPEYNGFKVCNGYDTIYGLEIQRLRSMMELGRFVSGEGRIQSYDVMTPYLEYITRNINITRKLRVGVDGGNATAGPVALGILEKLGCEIHPLYCEMDGTFPNHEPDPTILDNLKDLIELVRRERLDAGIAFDGDGDRIGVVDSRGEVVYGDKLMIVFAREILTRNPGATFISEVKCSKTLYEDIESRGGKAIMWKTGHSLIKAKMKETNAVLAGEMSGHMFFKDRYLGFDDAVYAACRLLEILADTGKSIPELLDGVPPTLTTPEIRVSCPDSIKFEVVEKVKAFFQKEGYPIIDVDGARVMMPGGWGLVRGSNTQPVLVLRYEAETGEQLESNRNLMERIVDEAKTSLMSHG